MTLTKPRPFITILPALMIVSFLAATVSLFFLGPVQWKPMQPSLLLGYLVAALSLFTVAYLAGTQITPRASDTLPTNTLIIAGSLLSIAMLFPSAYFYADKMPWEIIDAIRDQKKVYEGLQKRLNETQSGRELVALARAVTFPLIYAAGPLCILHMRNIPKWYWGLFCLLMASAITFSILRGTDREAFDFTLLVASSGLILIGRNLQWFKTRISKRLVLAGCIIGILIASLGYQVFGQRRLQRADMTIPALGELLEKSGPHGGYMTIMCIRSACADKDNLLIAHVAPFHKYAITMVTNYLTNGYYGLSLALDDPTPFQSTLGIGHAPAIKRLYERVTHDTTLYEKSYTARLNSAAWSDNSEWATIFVWLANDVGFSGALAVFVLLGLAYAVAWRDATIEGNDYAAVVFCFLTQLLIYTPANFQIGQTLDSYLGFSVWLAAWLIRRRHHSHR